MKPSTKPSWRRGRRRMKTDNIVHKCACGLTYTAAGWLELEYLDDWVDDEGTLEMRHCVCGSTRSIRLPQRKHTEPWPKWVPRDGKEI